MPTVILPSAPAEIVGSPLMPEALVRQHLAEAIHACMKAQYRLSRLRRMSPADAEKAWADGPEGTWFFACSERKLEKLLSIFQRVTQILTSAKLKILCKDAFPYYGAALPLVMQIKLGAAWANGSDLEKTQTLVHEASHIAGRVVLDENRWYGPDNGKRLARWAYRHPMRPTRSADNLGYYAMDCLAGGTAGIFSAA